VLSAAAAAVTAAADSTPRRGGGSRGVKASAVRAKAKAAAEKAAAAAAAAAVAVTKRRATRAVSSMRGAPAKRMSMPRTSTKAKPAPRGVSKTPTKQARKTAAPAKPKVRTPRRKTVRKKKSVVDVDKARGLFGKRIGIKWPEDGAFYDAMVLSFDEKTGLHKIYYYPTDASGEQIELADLFDESREWRMAETLPSSGDQTAQEDPFALVGSRICVEWPDRHVGDQKMHRCEAIVVKYNTEKSYRVVYTQDEYVEDRDLSSANSLPWQILTEESPKADGNRAEAPPQGDDVEPATEANGQSRLFLGLETLHQRSTKLLSATLTSKFQSP
jgi:hypothetical protein